MDKHVFRCLIIMTVVIFTVPDVLIHMVFVPLREDMLMTFPMVAEAVSESFNVIFAIAIMILLGLDYEKGKPIFYLIIGSILFYISQLHDLFDEFFLLEVPSIAFEVLAFPLALIFAALGIREAQKYQRRLYQDNEQLKMKYKELSMTDNLTRLSNTRCFYQFVPKLIADNQAKNQPLTLMVIDIDDFKHVNDTYGHVEGDRVIEYIGGLINKEFAGAHQCFRYGGEEFVIVLENEGLETSVELANRLREQFAKKKFHTSTATYHKTLSVGLATLKTGDNITTLLAKADRAMYAAKNRGKNRVCYDLY